MSWDLCPAHLYFMKGVMYMKTINVGDVYFLSSIIKCNIQKLSITICNIVNFFCKKVFCWS